MFNFWLKTKKYPKNVKRKCKTYNIFNRFSFSNTKAFSRNSSSSHVRQQQQQPKKRCLFVPALACLILHPATRFVASQVCLCSMAWFRIVCDCFLPLIIIWCFNSFKIKINNNKNKNDNSNYHYRHHTAPCTPLAQDQHQHQRHRLAVRLFHLLS